MFGCSPIQIYHPKFRFLTSGCDQQISPMEQWLHVDQYNWSETYSGDHRNGNCEISGRNCSVFCSTYYWISQPPKKLNDSTQRRAQEYLSSMVCHFSVRILWHEFWNRHWSQNIRANPWGLKGRVPIVYQISRLWHTVYFISITFYDVWRMCTLNGPCPIAARTLDTG